MAKSAAISMFVVLFCLLDALKISLRFKTMILIIVSLSFSILAYKSTVDAISETYTIDINLWNGSSYQLEILGLISSSLRIIAVFA